MVGLFLFKVVAALVLYWIYTGYYSDRPHADIFRYYDDSYVIFKALPDHPYDYFRMMTGIDAESTDLEHYYQQMRNWYNSDLVFKDTRTMIRFSAFLRIFFADTYFPHAVVMCFLAFLGQAGLFRVFRKYVQGKDLVLILLIFLMPSVLLWTSGIIKEALLFFAMGWLIHVFDRLKSRSANKRGQIIILFLSAFIMLTVKAYVFFLLIPFLIAWVFDGQQRIGNSWLYVSGIFFISYIVLVLIAPVMTGHSIPDLISSRRAEFVSLATLNNAGSLIDLSTLRPDWLSLFSDSPAAVFRTVFYPLPNMVGNLMMAFSSAEIMIYLIFITWLLLQIKKSDFRGIPVFVIAGLFFSLSVFLLAGWVTPVIGALVRYKIPGLPFFLLFFVFFSNHRMLKTPDWLCEKIKPEH